MNVLRKAGIFIHHNAGVAALIIACLGFAGGYHALATESRQRSAVDSARTAQLRWDKTADDHDACIRQAASRVEVRVTFDRAFDTIARFAAPLQRAEVLRFVADEKQTVAKALPPLDCSNLAPSPEGSRPTIPG